MLFNKNHKAQFPLIKTLIILMVAIIILLTYLFLLAGEKVSIEDKKLNSQIAIDKVFIDNCFSDDFGFIDPEKFNQDTMNSCFDSLEEAFVRINLNSKLIKDKTLYFNKDGFIEKVNYCNLKSSQLCTELKFPVLVGNKNNYETKVLTLQIITI